MLIVASVAVNNHLNFSGIISRLPCVAIKFIRPTYHFPSAVKRHPPLPEPQLNKDSSAGMQAGRKCTLTHLLFALYADETSSEKNLEQSEREWWSVFTAECATGGKQQGNLQSQNILCSMKPLKAEMTAGPAKSSSLNGIQLSFYCFVYKVSHRTCK